MYLAFFPQENDDQLTELREGLTPFLKTVSKGLSFELENSFLDGHYGKIHYEKMKAGKKSIFDEILQNVPAENTVTNCGTISTVTLNTLNKEFDKLLDLQ